MSSINPSIPPVSAAPRPQATTYEPKVDWAAANQAFRYWRVRLLIVTMIGYAIYYFVRTNIGPALSTMQSTLGYNKAQLGTILTVGGVTYGVAKFVMGFFGDRANPRYFMAVGLLLCAAMNVLFGFSTSLLMLGSFWVMNNWAQGMAFPPCAKTMANWFSPKERSTTFGIWHAGHTVGAALVGVLVVYLLKHFGDWRLAFFVQAGIAVAGAIFIVWGLRDSPASMNLPPVEVYKGEESPEEVDVETGRSLTYMQLVRRNVLTNKFMWIISIANFLVYTLRYASLDWGVTYLQEMKKLDLVTSGWLVSASEIAGFTSALTAGIVADRMFRGRAGRVCVLAMLAMVVLTYLFLKSPPGSKLMVGSLFIGMQFMVYVPQMLIAAMAMNLGTKRAAAVAVGLTGIVGYLSKIPSGWGVGYIVDHEGWGGAFYWMIGCAAGTAVLMALTWNVGAHPQLEKRAEGFEVLPERPRDE